MCETLRYCNCVFGEWDPRPHGEILPQMRGNFKNCYSGSYRVNYVPLWTMGGTTLIKRLKTRSSLLPLWTFFVVHIRLWIRFDEAIYQQKEGSPIGLQLTGAIARIWTWQHTMPVQHTRNNIGGNYLWGKVNIPSSIPMLNSTLYNIMNLLYIIKKGIASFSWVLCHHITPLPRSKFDAEKLTVINYQGYITNWFTWSTKLLIARIHNSHG